MKLTGFIVFCSAIFLLGVVYKLVRFQMSVPGTGAPLKQVYYEVKLSENPKKIASDLEELGVVTDARLFYWYGRVTGKAQKFKAADYRFTNQMKPNEVAATLMSGVSYGRPLVIPEGFNMAQIAESLEKVRPRSKERFLKLCSDRRFIETLSVASSPPLTLEGYLFPDTYLVGRTTSEEEVIRQMVRKFSEVFTTDLARRARVLGMSEHQVVTLASIIEKETGAKHERPMISSVFHNRLKKRMRLQSDPTVIYGIKGYGGNLTRKDLQTSTPYNTYVIAALPPGPIASPGREAILAALFPAESNYLYFVSHNDGTHEFTSTYEAHREAVVRFQLDRRNREGKSWRDLGKSGSAAGSR